MEDTGKLILRVTLGVLMLPHGMAKASSTVLNYLQGMLVDHGLPGFLAYGVYLGEVLAPLLMIVGYYTRPAAVVFAINAVLVIYLAYSRQLLQLEQYGGLVLEAKYMYVLGGIAVALLGAGKYSISGGKSKWD
ncbi:DoxX family protein [Aeoliella sp. ICT_H6.2]|uniref:DoxX family protein n=1 Tax=Aeoliella straminimaris TaxID=2954799 RepID=A0A9X2FGD1_9BACT|nr:DoxX family protein [Aeoliella straminimaris]MCO6043756.1 DoxX family protein [Aeoliella straminimaris]